MMRHWMAALLCAWGMMAGLGSRAEEQQRGAGDVHVTPDVVVTMRDGTRLSGDLYRPASAATPLEAPRPALLMRSPYNIRDAVYAGQAADFARHGYVVLLQNIRGRYRSEGAFKKYDAAGAADGFDTIQWLAAQPYTDGRVATFGTSYAAHTQADAAKLNPPALKLMVINQGGMANAWDHAVRHGGAFELGRELTWAWEQIKADAATPVVREYLEREKVTDWYHALPLRPGLSPLAAAPEFERYFLREYTESDYGPLWREMGVNWEEYYEQTADVPMVHIGGWYDIFLRGTIQNYQRLSGLKQAPMRLLIGPWNHHGNMRTYTGDVDFGPASAIADFETGFYRRWFDFYLGAPSGGESPHPQPAPVRLFVMGTGDGRKDAHGRLSHGGYWRDADAWPPPDATPLTLFLQGGGRLSTSAPPSDGGATTYTYDPAHPVPTLGGSVSNRVRDGAYDQRERPDFFGSRPPYLPLRARADVLVFQTDPLPDDVTVIGPVEADLYVASSAVDTDFTAKLVDVYPPSADYPSGFDLNITDALVRMRYRDERKTAALIEPGRTYKITIRLFPTANVFKKGHRIRLDVSSSNFPRFDPNPNTGEPLGRHRRTVRADNTVYHDAARPSVLRLSMVPATASSR